MNTDAEIQHRKEERNKKQAELFKISTTQQEREAIEQSKISEDTDHVKARSEIEKRKAKIEELSIRLGKGRSGNITDRDRVKKLEQSEETLIRLKAEKQQAEYTLQISERILAKNDIRRSGKGGILRVYEHRAPTKLEKFLAWLFSKKLNNYKNIYINNITLFNQLIINGQLLLRNGHVYRNALTNIENGDSLLSRDKYQTPPPESTPKLINGIINDFDLSEFEDE